MGAIEIPGLLSFSFGFTALNEESAIDVESLIVGGHGLSPFSLG